MGYYTRFTLETPTYPQWWSELTPAERKNVEALSTGYVEAVIEHDDTYKWYEHEKNMLAISRLYEDTIFVLSGEGEEPGDIWKEYYLDGKVVHCQAALVFPNPPDWAILHV